MVVPAHDTMIVELEAEQRSGVLLTIDGQETVTLEPNDRIYIRQSSFWARIIASDRRMFYKALRTKLHWSGSPESSLSADLPAEASFPAEATFPAETWGGPHA
jgi:NAD+ kinase